MDVPECSVCLQPYDDCLIIPRVLSCGHSLCERCISSLSDEQGRDDDNDDGGRRTSFLRCPECNQRSKLQGLPKNIELLRFIRTAEPARVQPAALPSKPRSCTRRGPSFVYEASVVELCRWIIPQHSAKITHPPSGQVFLCRGEETLERICSATFLCVKGAWPRLKGSAGGLGSDYRWKVRSCLERLVANEIKDLLHLLRAQEGVFGIWMDAEEGCLYLVYTALTECEQLAGALEEVGTLTPSNAFVKRGMEICEVFMRLHKEHVLAGLITPHCLGNSDFLHIRLNVDALFSARKLLTLSVKAIDPPAREILSQDNLFQSMDTFPFFYASPELLMEMIKPDTFSTFNIACKTDSWTLACLFCEFFLGGTPWDGFALEDFLQKSVHSLEHAHSWIRQHIDLETAHNDPCIGDLFVEFVRKLIRCFSHSPNDRPCISEIWHLLNGMQLSSNTPNNGFVPNRDLVMCCDAGTGASTTLWCLALGCHLYATRREVTAEKRGSSVSCVGMSQFEAQEWICRSLKDDVAAVQKPGILEGHSGNVTCLAICGQYLLSASLDKTVCVWSLKDDTLIKSLKGHSQKVMALVSDQQSSVFISGDYGGELFAWDVESTAASCLNKWHHHQDWRYSGVASLAISPDNLLYSGAGDRTIKVWSLQDYGLITIMEGHKALVSALLIDGEVLYSGSWDGTIRLWWRCDHCPLAVLNESIELGAVLALAGSAELLMAGYQSGRLQVWKDETCINSIAAHDNTISSLCLYGDRLYSGSWDESIKAWKVDELVDDATPTLVAKCGSAIKAVVCFDKSLFVGLSSKAISVYMNKAC